ncbi:ketopantoate reductase family protein [Halohasta salina]|uniref:ketopantoate reductase family protein n=1 Tax=Halohasta salina TaxID=2961621 RepID=UPI0020A2BFB8|nr:2-dehydropantoate 2-reductase [Halohasta salina]
MEIVVFGAGSLGSLVGGLLAGTHDVTLVGRSAHMRAIEADGLTVGGAVETTVRPRTTTDSEGLSGDVVLVTVKAGDTATAAEALSTGSFNTVCSLQNGFTEETLVAELSVPVLAGTVTYGARLREPGHVDCTGRGTVTLGPYTEDSAADDAAAAERAAAVGEAFRAADIETDVRENMAKQRWEKLAVNAAINPVTALARVENGAVCEEPLWPVARRAARETAAVARASGVDLSDDTAVEAVRTVAASTAANRSSMLQDVDAGRVTEIEAINGAVVERGAQYGVDVPTNRLLTALVNGSKPR